MEAGEPWRGAGRFEGAKAGLRKSCVEALLEGKGSEGRGGSGLQKSTRSVWQDSVTLGCVGFLCSLGPQPGGVCLLSPSRDVFLQGLPDEYAFVTTFRLRKSSRREDWYIWQVIDQYGIPQVRAARRVPVLASVSSLWAGQHRCVFSTGPCLGP